jgi:hypothetical protein
MPRYCDSYHPFRWLRAINMHEAHLYTDILFISYSIHEWMALVVPSKPIDKMEGWVGIKRKPDRFSAMAMCGWSMWGEWWVSGEKRKMACDLMDGRRSSLFDVFPRLYDRNYEHKGQYRCAPEPLLSVSLETWNNWSLCLICFSCWWILQITVDFEILNLKKSVFHFL